MPGGNPRRQSNLFATLETEFQRTRNPHISTIRRLAAETNNTPQFVKDWFKQKRSAVPIAAPVVPVVHAEPPAPVPAAPVGPPVPPVVAQPHRMTVRGQPNWRPGMEIQPEVTTVMGSRINVTRNPGTTRYYKTKTVIIPPQIEVVVPEVADCFPTGLIDEFEQNGAGGEISDENEKIYRTVLLRKLKCGICVASLMSIMCTGCSNGLCKNCSAGLARHAGPRLQCPYCRLHPNPFVPLKFPRI